MTVLFYGIAAVALCFFVFSCVRLYPLMKAGAVGFLSRYSFTRALMENVRFRAGVAVTWSFLLNLLYGIFEGTLAILSQSLWYGALGGYHLCLGIMRFRLVLHEQPFQETKEPKHPAHHRGVYKSTGTVLLLLSVLMAVAVAEMITSPATYAGVMLFGVTAYVTLKFVLSIRRFLHAKRQNSPTLKAIRSIGIADALMSLFSLQTALLSAFYFDAARRNTLSGIAGGTVCMVVASMAILMLRQKTER